MIVHASDNFPTSQSKPHTKKTPNNGVVYVK